MPDVPAIPTVVVPSCSVVLPHAVASTPVTVQDDAYSDRIRCDHPGLCDPAALAEALLDVAAERGRGRVVVLAPVDAAPALGEAGFCQEGVMPGFYRGERDCAVLGAYPDTARAELARPDAAQHVYELLEQAQHKQTDLPEDLTRRATVEDAMAVAELIGETFVHYPTPSHDPDYIAQAIVDGTPFRVVESAGDIVACASADLVRAAKTAELTDCATRPDHRGRGYMRAILADLMHDLRGLGYPTAFTLARAAIPGVNLAFARLGFELRGCMPQSCRIGTGLEDMNIWSRRLDVA